jgi:UDP-glucose 4-epimerase
MGARKHVIVTGGAGFIGSHLVERLLADGKAVIVIDDLSTGSLDNLQAVKGHPRLRMLQSRVSQCSELPELTADAESIYHLAAAVGVELVLSAPIQSIQNNLHETEAILEAASAHQVPVLLTSSSEVYGKSQKGSFSEDDDLLIGPPTHLRWSYACSKLMDEFMAMGYARERGLPVVIARLFNTVGPRQTGRYGMVLPRFIAAAKAGKPLRVFGDGKQTRCFCWVGDAVEALVRLQDSASASGEVFNIGGTEEISILDLAGRVKHQTQSASPIELVPYAEAYAPGFEDLGRRRPNIAKLSVRADTGNPLRLADVLARLILEPNFDPHKIV